MRYKFVICNQLVSSCSTEKTARTGRSFKISERGGRIVCLVANKLRFVTSKFLVKAVVKSIRQSDVCKIGIKYIIKAGFHLNECNDSAE